MRNGHWRKALLNPRDRSIERGHIVSYLAAKKKRRRPCSKGAPLVHLVGIANCYLGGSDHGAMPVSPSPSSKIAISRVSDEFETCPIWVPGMDGRRRTTPIILKTLDVDRFDHSASWPSKVRNVSRLGRQISKLQVGFELLPSTHQTQYGTRY